MLLEFIQGGELFSLIRKEKKLKIHHAQFYAAEILLAI